MMFNPRKKKIQIKSVEDYLKSEDARIPVREEETATPGDPWGKVRTYVGPAIAVLIVLGLVFAAYSQLNKLQSELAELQAQKAGDAAALRLQVAALSAKLEKSEKRIEGLFDNIAGIERELEAERAAQRERAEAAARKPPSPRKMRKPSGPRF